MTGTQALISRIALGCTGACASIVLVGSRQLQTMLRERFDRILFSAFAISRLGLFGAVFLLLGVAPRGDVQAYYFDQAQWVLRGMVPYRDFISSYAPLHPYLDAALISLWRTPLAIMLLSMLGELFLLPVWTRAGRDFLPEDDLRAAALLYLGSPISLQFVAIDGQDNVLIALLIGLALLLILRSRETLAGAVFGLSIAAIKFLPLLYAPAFLLTLPRRWRMTAGAAVVVGMVYGGFLLFHAPVLVPLHAEAELRSAGNLPYLVEAVFGITVPGHLSDGILLIAVIGILATVGWAARGGSKTRRLRVMTNSFAALTLALLLLSKKSWPPYLMLALFPICLAAGAGPRRGKIYAFALLSVVALTEHSYWSGYLRQPSSATFHQALGSHQPGAFVLLGLELLLVGGYLWLLGESMRRLCRESSPHL
jgi:hypothetical protein